MDGKQKTPSGTLAANRTAKTKRRRGNVSFSFPIVPNPAPKSNRYGQGRFHFAAAEDAKRRGDRARFLYHRRAGLLCQAAAYMRQGVNRGRT